MQVNISYVEHSPGKKVSSINKFQIKFLEKKVSKVNLVAATKISQNPT